MNYSQLHYWANKHIKKPKKCQHCKKVKKLDLANKSKKYLETLDDWLFLCRSCHIKYDITDAKRIQLSTLRKGKIPWNKNLKGIHLSPKSEFKKGHSMNIGKKNGMYGKTPWNKGKKLTNRKLYV